MENAKISRTGREMNFSRLLDAPIEQVWEVWTNPDHIRLWWGPKGFSNTIHKMEIKPGGAWELIMHGPDGRDYEIKCVFHDIVKHKKIVYEQLTAFKCVATIEFEQRKQKTFISWTMQFKTTEDLRDAVKTYGVETGFEQNADRLVNYLLHFK